MEIYKRADDFKAEGAIVLAKIKTGLFLKMVFATGRLV